MHGCRNVEEKMYTNECFSMVENLRLQMHLNISEFMMKKSAE